MLIKSHVCKDQDFSKYSLKFKFIDGHDESRFESVVHEDSN